jgi:hypothetical protein
MYSIPKQACFDSSAQRLGSPLASPQAKPSGEAGVKPFVRLSDSLFFKEHTPNVSGQQTLIGNRQDTS